jgi:hypothetical protein
MGLPIDVKDVFEALASEINWLHCRWKIHAQLFGHSDQRIELLNEAAGPLFYVVQETLQNEIFVTLSKITDPAKTGSKSNLSFAHLFQQIEVLGHAELLRELSPLLERVSLSCEPLRLHRNKRLAHLDLSVALENGVSALPLVTGVMVDGSLRDVRDFMNCIEGHYCDSETGYEHFSMPGGDGDALVGILKYGFRYEDLLTKGAIDINDIEASAWPSA